MVEIDDKELATLEEIAALEEHGVLDGASLYSLLQKDLVELSNKGWRLTSFGAETFEDFFGAEPAA